MIRVVNPINHAKQNLNYRISSRYLNIRINYFLVIRIRIENEQKELYKGLVYSRFDEMSDI